MPNKSHYNSGHIALNRINKLGSKHSSVVKYEIPAKTNHFIYTADAIEFLKKIPSNSIQLVLIDPPYNIDLSHWDTFNDYLAWARQWIDEIERILTNNGNVAIFGGFQYQDLKKGDLLEVMHYLRHNTNLIFVNLIIWYYKNGMSAHRFFANRHEEIIWFAKSKKYYFDLDSVRVPFDEETKKIYKKDKRLNPESIEKGKNPTNVWEIGRLNGNSIERVGHPTQKPLEVIRRLVRGLSYPGATVLDFFAGSGTTGRICIEENRNSILVDNDKISLEYFKKHLQNMKTTNNYEIFENKPIEDFYEQIMCKS